MNIDYSALTFCSKSFFSAPDMPKTPELKPWALYVCRKILAAMIEAMKPINKPSTSSFRLEDLPNELLDEVFGHLSKKERTPLHFVSRRCRNVAQAVRKVELQRILMATITFDDEGSRISTSSHAADCLSIMTRAGSERIMAISMEEFLSTYRCSSLQINVDLSKPNLGLPRCVNSRNVSLHIGSGTQTAENIQRLGDLLASLSSSTTLTLKLSRPTDLPLLRPALRRLRPIRRLRLNLENADNDVYETVADVVSCNAPDNIHLDGATLEAGRLEKLVQAWESNPKKCITIFVALSKACLSLIQGRFEQAELRTIKVHSDNHVLSIVH